MTTGTAAPTPVLRTLAPALRRLDERLRDWRALPRDRSLSTLQQATIEGLSSDLQRQAATLEVDRPLLVIVLMGGTGVGKSTLLNALAGSAIAQASFTRPTTRDPVVYYHESIRPDRLDKTLQGCKLIAHDRAPLEQKIIVDTPDLDSNEVTHREKLKRLLPVADVVLYVGSQEKYHDRLGWELFLEQRRRRGFAFVLNKWDRCSPLGDAESTGLRPDEDLLRDLKEEGFDQPLLFRTCAQAWIDANGQPPQVPEGEQFAELMDWLERGLTRVEIEAIKARGVGQLLQQLEAALEAARPPDLSDAAVRTTKAWQKALDAEAQAMADILLVTIDPHQREIEQHFSLEGHRRFRGLMAGFLHLATKVRYLGATVRKYLPAPLRGDLAEAAASSAWDLASFSRSCTALASDRHLDARGRALPNALQVLADQHGFPIALLNNATESAAKIDWRGRFSTVLVEVLHEVESQWARPTGSRRGLQNVFIWVGDIVPLVVLLASCLIVLNDYFHLWSQDRLFSSLYEAILFPLVAVLLTLLILYLLIIFLLPIRWPAIRSTFHRRLTERLREELGSAYLPIPQEVADRLLAERRQLDELLADCREVRQWLRTQEQAAGIEALYGD
jgi:energy-coupling factor transporter ATP-binding protein EcfA2